MSLPYRSKACEARTGGVSMNSLLKAAPHDQKIWRLTGRALFNKPLFNKLAQAIQHAGRGSHPAYKSRDGIGLVRIAAGLDSSVQRKNPDRHFRNVGPLRTFVDKCTIANVLLCLRLTVQGKQLLMKLLSPSVQESGPDAMFLAIEHNAEMIIQQTLRDELEQV